MRKETDAIPPPSCEITEESKPVWVPKTKVETAGASPMNSVLAATWLTMRLPLLPLRSATITPTAVTPLGNAPPVGEVEVRGVARAAGTIRLKARTGAKKDNFI